MGSNISQKPPDEHKVLFDLEQCKTAPLICHTPFETSWNMQMGFTALNTFYQTNELTGFSSEWIHDEGNFRLQSYFSPVNDDTLTLMFKYDSFVRFNVNVKHRYRCFGDNSNIYEVEVVFVTKHTPIFCFRIWNPNTERYNSGRYYKQWYQNEANEYWSDILNAKAFKLTYKVEKSKLYSWMRKLIERLPCTVTSNEMIHEIYRGPSNPSTMEFIISRLPAKAQYNIECIQSFGTVGDFLLDYYLFHRKDIEMLKRLEKSHQSNLVSEYFELLYKFLKKDISLSSLNFDPNSYPAKVILGNQYVPIKLAIVTPTSIIFEAEEDNVNCRGFRKLGYDKILQVKFVDEDGAWFPKDENLLNDKMHYLLRNGISVAGKTYFEFGCSSSLFRQHGTYFFESSCQQAIINVINELAVFKLEPAAKVAARLGLLFSSATEIKMKLRNNEIGHLEDFKSTPRYLDEPEYNFSDGIGIIDISFARRIQEELGLPYLPSAYQFRCLGCKGMVAIDPYNKDLVSNNGPYVVMFRDSQCKFKTITEREVDFDVVKYSSPAPLKLHRSFISLMVALARDQGLLEVVERRLHELFTESVAEVLLSLYEPNAFMTALKTLPKHFPIDIFGAQQLIQQDFLRSIVEVNAVNLCRQLNSKCQIPLPESLGRQALGVVDEIGLLKPGEIFFQYFKDTRTKSANPDKTVLTGKVGITKSPMYHLGDIRFLQAVDYPELHHHENVVVFSQFGPRPIPDQIGGGDLDGDSYCIFWDPVFLLLEHSDAAEFPSPDSSHLPNISIDDLHEHHASFRVNYELKNNLEQLSNCFISHIALHHPEHPEVKKISEKADTAVNSFKSNVFAAPISKNEKPIYNPNFCNKRHEPMFDSDHILSQLHKRIFRIYLLMQITQDEAQKERTRMKDGGNIQTSEYARGMYESYCNEITNLMNKFNIKTEAELFANVKLESPGSFNTFKSCKNEEETIAMIQEYLSNIIGKFRRQILDQFKDDWEEDMFLRQESLSTYYIDSYLIPNEMRILAKEFQALAENDGKFLSFPYLMVEALDFSIHTYHVDRSVTLINKIMDDFINLPFDINSLDQDASIALEEHLIRLAFSPTAVSTFNENVMQERIISYPSFVISVPQFYSEQFRDNYQLLKELYGIHDISIRLRKDKKYYHHYTIICESSMKNCIKLETELTPFIKYDETMQVSLAEMKKRKTQAMQRILEDIFGFIPPPPPPPRRRQQQRHHSQTTPGALRQQNEHSSSSSSTDEEIQPRNYNMNGFGNPHHVRHWSGR